MPSALVIGAGAIGGLLAARLALAGHDIAVVARGAHLDAIRVRGALALETPQGIRYAPMQAYATAADAPDAAVVFVTLKAYQLPSVAADIAKAVRRAGAYVPIQNGIPWWYFQRSAGAHTGRIVRAVDPEGRLVAQLAGAPIIPAFATVAAEVITPGHVFNLANDTDGFPLGPLDPHDESAADMVATMIRSTGLHAPRCDVRQWVWIKLLGNIWANPIGALTRATVAQIAGTPIARTLALALMHETQAVARAFGVDPGVDFEQRLDRGIRLRQGIRSSMLQDVERGRPTEHRAILGALVELAGLADVDVPHVSTLNACMELLAQHPGNGLPLAA